MDDRKSRSKNYWMLKAPIEFKEKLDSIRIARIKNDKDRKITSYKRLCLAISRHDKFLDDLSKADFIRDKKAQMETGSVFNIFSFMIIAFVVVVFFAGLIYTQGLLTSVFHEVGLSNEVNVGQPTYVNMTLAADQTFGVLNSSIQSLKMVAAVYILALVVCILITNALMKMSPLWFFAYMLLSILAIIFSVPISNAYQSLYSSNIFNGTLQGFNVSNWILFNLPIFVLFVAVIGAIFLFINIIRSGQEATTFQ